MKTKSQPHLLENITNIYRQARENQTDECCMVAPSPELREQIQKELEQLRSSTSDTVANLLQVRDKTAPGLNDGLIYPGSLFPVGTPLHIARSAAANRAPLRGTLQVIVVLVEFSDRAMGQTQQHFQDLFFSLGVLPNGSVREYYREVSNNLVDITGTVVGPYQLPLTLAQYANGASGMGGALPNARTMARDAATAADPNVNFGPYDNDGDGFVDAFIVIHAGSGAEVTGSANDIWSHKWVLSGGTYNADGTQIYAYLTVPEDSKIGVCSHELGHLLFGFPDLYDTDYSSEGIGNWCLMAGGSWNGGGDIPAHPSAWCKANQEWVTVNNPTSNSTGVSINDVKTSFTVYKLWKDGTGTTEYFLVENRQQTLYDQRLPGSGLLIWHVDDTIASNSDENHPKVALMQADGLRDLEQGNNRGDAGDPYPGSSNNITFNNASTPNSRSYAGTNTCVAVTNISAPGSTMTADLSVTCIKLKERGKEIKDIFDDKGARKEFKEWKEFKEKDRKEFKENLKDIKDVWEKDPREKDPKEKDKDFEKPGEKPGDWPGNLGAPSAGLGQYGAGNLEARLAALENRLGSIEPFIDASLRPDLRRSALAAEEDVEETRPKKQTRSTGTKKKRTSTRKS